MNQRILTLAAVLLIASLAAGWAAVSADEPDPIVLVSNTEVDASLGSDNFQRDYAQEFRTGKNPFGYTVAGVRLAFIVEDPDGDPASFRVELWSLAQSGGPGVELLGTFENPETLADHDDGGSYFAAPEDGIKLEPNRSYLILFEVLDRGSWATSASIRSIRSNHEDLSGEYRWNIHNLRRHAAWNQTGGNRTWGTHNDSLWLRVEGHEDRLAPKTSQVQAQSRGTVLLQISAAARAASPCGRTQPALTGAEQLASVRLACDTATGEWVKVQLAVPGLDYALERDLQDGNPNTNGCSAGQRYDPIRKVCLTYPPGQ